MRHVLITTAILMAPVLASPIAARPALADRFEAAAPVRAVTVYPAGASVTRETVLDLPAGAHELVITGLPQGIDPTTLRVSATGATLGAMGLQQARALPDSPVEPPQIAAAKAEVQRLETALAQRDADAARIRARGEAASDTIDFLMALAESDGAGNQDIASLAGTVGQQILQARQTMIDAEAEAEAALQGRDDQQAELERAQARLDTLREPDSDPSAVIVALQGQGGPATIRLTSLTPDASWQPVYDVSLARDAAKVTLERGLLVTQMTGEDWSDVHLVLSTAQVLGQVQPAELLPLFPRIAQNLPEYSRGVAAAGDGMSDMAERAYAPAPQADPEAIAPVALPGFAGQTVIYDYPAAVTVRNAADALRLPLDALTLDATVLAEAVPRRDSRAYLVADLVNSSGAVLLPGQAVFHADGAMTGRGTLDLTAAGDDMTLGFGPLNGIVLERHLPDETEGGRGIIVKSAERTESALLRIRNLTGQDWPLRVIDQVPVSTQKDLRIDWRADPAPDQTDPDGKRGLLVWNRNLAAGEAQEIALTTTLRWPDGQILTGDY